MKELTIEEKAKAYDRALEIAKAWYKLDNNDLSNDDLETLFPELKERDERIRKEIIEYIKTGTYHKSWIAWLEKQGEIDKSSYEIAEKEKREFVGDGFIKCYADFQDFKEGNTYWLEYIGNDKYNVRSDNLLGKTYHITPCQLYTVFKKQTWLEKQSKQKEQLINKACALLVNCIEDFMSRRMEIWDEECKKQTLENIRKKLEE